MRQVNEVEAGRNLQGGFERSEKPTGIKIGFNNKSIYLSADLHWHSTSLAVK